MKTTNVILFILFYFSFLISAQEFKIDTSSTKETNKKMHFSTMTGTSFWGSSYASGNNFFVRPSVGYQISSKLFIASSIGFNQMNFTSKGENNSAYSTGMFSINSSAFYKMNDKLSVYGSVYKTIDNGQQTSMNPQALNFNSQGASMGLMYKLTDHLTIGVEVRQHNGNGYMNPNRSFFSPFPTSPMNSMFMGR